MKAAVVTDVTMPIELQDRPIPEPGPGPVLVRIEACGRAVIGSLDQLRGLVDGAAGTRVAVHTAAELPDVRRPALAAAL